MQNTMYKLIGMLVVAMGLSSCSSGDDSYNCEKVCGRVAEWPSVKAHRVKLRARWLVLCLRLSCGTRPMMSSVNAS